VTDERVGAALNRDLGSPVAPGEQVEHEIDQFIARRHEQRVKHESERAEEEAWQESSRRSEDCPACGEREFVVLTFGDEAEAVEYERRS
jgi:hypothetical protein